MAKQERDKLAPTGHPLGMLLAMMMSDCRVKYRLGKELQNLTENAGYSYHGWVSPFSWLIQQLQLYSDSLTLPCIDAQLRWHSPGPGGSVNVLDRSAFFIPEELDFSLFQVFLQIRFELCLNFGRVQIIAIHQLRGQIVDLGERLARHL